MAYVVVGETQAIAEEKERLFLDAYVHPVASLALLSELLNYDFAKHDLDDVVSDEMMAASSGIRGLSMGVRKHLGRDVTVRDLAAHRATLLQGPRFVGTATVGGGPDGGVVQLRRLRRVRPRRHPPARRVRGVRPDGGAWNCSGGACSGVSTAGTTLREHLGIARPRRTTTGMSVA